MSSSHSVEPLNAVEPLTQPGLTAALLGFFGCWKDDHCKCPDWEARSPPEKFASTIPADVTGRQRVY